MGHLYESFRLFLFLYLFFWFCFCFCRTWIRQVGVVVRDTFVGIESLPLTLFGNHLGMNTIGGKAFYVFEKLVVHLDKVVFWISGGKIPQNLEN